MRLDEAKEERTEQELLALLKTSCRRSHLTATRAPIFACFNKAPDYFTQGSSKLSSRFIIDNALADLKLSERSKASVFGFTSAALAQQEQNGDVYVLFPFDKSLIWVAPEGDYYKSFAHANKVLRVSNVGNKALQEALAFLGEFETWPQLKRLLEEPDVQRFKGDDNAARLASFKQYHHGITWFKSLFDLDANGFVRLLSSQAAPTQREVWVNGDVFAVKADKYDDLHKRKLIHD